MFVKLIMISVLFFNSAAFALETTLEVEYPSGEKKLYNVTSGTTKIDVLWKSVDCSTKSTESDKENENKSYNIQLECKFDNLESCKETVKEHPRKMVYFFSCSKSNIGESQIFSIFNERSISSGIKIMCKD